MGSRAPAHHRHRPPSPPPKTQTTTPTDKMFRLVPLLALASASPAASPSASLLACKACSPPTFPPTPQGRPLWLPHCVNGKSLNFCDAVCSGNSCQVKTKEAVRAVRQNVEWCSHQCALSTSNSSSPTSVKHSVQVLRRLIARA